MFRYIVSLVLITACLSSALPVAAQAGPAPAPRQNGFILWSLGIDTDSIEQALGAGYDPLADRINLVGIEGTAVAYNGWTIGAFAVRGQISSATATHRSELGVSLGGLSVETLLRQAGVTSYLASARIGVGKYALKLVDVTSEKSIDDLADAASTPTATTVTSPVWVLEPGFGMRTRLGDFVICEARLGYGLSMTSGQWRHIDALPDIAHVKLGGITLTVGIKLSAF
jgi:hypothetical protein